MKENPMINKELPLEAVELINRGKTTIILATIDENGQPRTAPFAWIYSPDPKTIRIAIYTKHDTYKNIQRGGWATACILGENNIALSAKGRARTIKEKLDCSPITEAVVELNITEVKSDVSAVGRVARGVEISINEKFLETTQKVYSELKSC
jgi:flavin reductase (DIM6/NTAB) family NADH-FMN oxidoreductase RutF